MPLERKPDYNRMVHAARNHKPDQLPLYEHIIDPTIIAKITDCPATPEGNADELDAYYSNYCTFWRDMTYDTVSWEGVLCEVLPDHGALMGGRPGPIQNRQDFEKYPFDELPERYWQHWAPHYDALKRHIPEGMQALGGVGNGIFEISEDLVGYEYLCLLQFEDPELFTDLYKKIGDVMSAIWAQMLERYGDVFCIGRMGDDLGFKSATLLAPDVIKQHILPQYRRISDIIHQSGKPFLLHSCGRIFDVMDDIIETVQIDAKHSNEDQIAPFNTWLERYNDRIGLFGGFDLNLLVQEKPDVIQERVFEVGLQYRQKAQGYALGSGNSIPDYIPPENYLAMLEGARKIRQKEMDG